MRSGLIGKAEDQVLTEALGYDELVVTTESYGQYHKAHLFTVDPGMCPHCLTASGAINKELGGKLYKDIIPGSDSITMFYYEFYKYKCANPDCGKRFRQPISFAGVSDDATYRLQRQIADLVAEGKSYAWISKRYPEIGTKTTVGNIYRKWVSNNLAKVSDPYTPASLGVFEIPFASGRDSFILFLDCNAGLNVIGVVPSDMTRLRKFISSLELQKVSRVLVNISPLVIDVISDYYAKQLTVIPVREWLHMVEEDYREYFKANSKHCLVPDAVDLLMSQEYAPYSKYNLDTLLQSRPGLTEARNNLLLLRKIINGHEFQWSIEELEDWVDSAEVSLDGALEVSAKAFHEYKDMISQGSSLPESSGIYWNLEELRRKFDCIKYCSEDFLTGFFLMRKDEYMKKINGHWYGVPLEVVLENETVVEYEE